MTSALDRPIIAYVPTGLLERCPYAGLSFVILFIELYGKPTIITIYGVLAHQWSVIAAIVGLSCLVSKGR